MPAASPAPAGNVRNSPRSQTQQRHHRRTETVPAQLDGNFIEPLPLIAASNPGARSRTLRGKLFCRDTYSSRSHSTSLPWPSIWLASAPWQGGAVGGQTAMGFDHLDCGLPGRRRTLPVAADAPVIRESRRRGDGTASRLDPIVTTAKGWSEVSGVSLFSLIMGGMLIPVPLPGNNYGHRGGHNDLIDWIIRGFGWRIGSDFAYHLPFAVVAVAAVGVLVIGARRRFGSGSRSSIPSRRRP